MARFSQQMLAGLLNPSYQQELTQVGRAIGGAPRSMMMRQQKEQRQAEIQELLKQHANNPAKLQQLANQYRAQGNEEAATAFTNAATQATTAQRERTAATTGRGEGELMALANDPEFDLNNQKMRSGYIGMADSFGVSRKRAMEIALKARENKEKGKGGEGQTFAGAGRYKDRNENIYVATEVRTKGGGVEIDYSPVTPGAPEQPSGPLTPIGGAYGETAGERTGRGIEETRRETEARDFAELRIAAIDSLPKIESTIVDAEKALGLLEDLRTGGFTTAFIRSAQRFLGVEPKNQAQFNLKAGEVVLKSLDNFPGAISNAEREYLERLYFGLEKSEGSNQGILQELLEAAQFALKDAKVRASSDTFQDYLDNRPSRVASVAKEEGPKKVNFDDLK